MKNLGLDKRPYAIVSIASAVAVLVIAIVANVVCLNRTWSGEYYFFDYQYADSTGILSLTMDAPNAENDEELTPSGITIEPFKKSAICNEVLSA